VENKLDDLLSPLTKAGDKFIEGLKITPDFGISKRDEKELKERGRESWWRYCERTYPDATTECVTRNMPER